MTVETTEIGFCVVESQFIDRETIKLSNFGAFNHEDFMFQMTKDEMEEWKSQIVIFNSENRGVLDAPRLLYQHIINSLYPILYHINLLFVKYA